jgi:hypothetical protein
MESVDSICIDLANAPLPLFFAARGAPDHPPFNLAQFSSGNSDSVVLGRTHRCSILKVV